MNLIKDIIRAVLGYNWSSIFTILNNYRLLWLIILISVTDLLYNPSFDNIKSFKFERLKFQI